MDRLKNNKKLQLFFKIINTFAEVILFGTLSILFVTVMVQIGGRIIGAPAPWTEEGTRYMFLWMMFIALSYGFRYQESARVVVFIDLLPKYMKKFTGCLYLAASLGFFAFIAYYGVVLVRQQIQMNEMGAAILIPMSLIGLTVPVSGVLGMITIVEGVIDNPEKLFGSMDGVENVIKAQEELLGGDDR